MPAKSPAYAARRASISEASARLRDEIGFDQRASTASAGIDASTFSLLYESSDARFCLFETADLHLNAVNAARLA